MAASEKLRFLAFGGIIFLVYLTELVLLCVLIYGKVTQRPIAQIFWNRTVWPVHILAVMGVLCFLYGYFVEPYWLQVSKFKIETHKISGTSFRIVQISDLHCDIKLRNEEKIVKIINSLEPDPSAAAT